MPSRPSNAFAFTRRLLRWFRRQGRQLPWRDTRDPYRVIVSEFMLQQTQVSRVREYYRRFLQRYPTIHHLARARPTAVRESWDGLGYYRRAANLHALARTVVREHDGQIPAAAAALRRLPGVGSYTAGAVGTFAFEKRVPAVDTNVARVLTRVFRPRNRRVRHIEDLAMRVLPTRGGTAWEFNQALMDLGALICTARRPRCEACPVRSACRTGRRGREP